jgi:cytochrome c553
VLLLAIAQAAALAGTEPDPQHGRVLYLKHCPACHGQQAWGDGPREIPALAGQRAGYLAEQLTRFASGARPGSQMHGPAMHETLSAPDISRQQAIGDLAAYLARAPVAPEPEQGDGRGLSEATSLYARACSGCHGEAGEGREDRKVPRIGAQHYRYLAARLREFAATHRGLDPDALASSAGLTMQQREALADYLSRLPGAGSP